MSKKNNHNTNEPQPTPTYWNRLTRWNRTPVTIAESETLAQHVGNFRSEALPPKLAKTLSRCSYENLSAEALTVVEGTFTDGPAELTAFIQDSVALAAPHTPYAAKLLTTTVTAYVRWCTEDKGWPLDAHIIWSVRAIDIYATTANLNRSEGTRRNYRGQLMRVSEVLLPQEHPERPTPLTKRKGSAPYTPKEMAGFRMWATGQLTENKRDTAMVMLVLCAGAGLRPNEIPHIYPSDVTVDSAGIVINVREERPRQVPLLAEWEEWMLALLQRLPADKPLWGWMNARTTHNLTSRFTDNSHGKPPRADRLRHTWLIGHLAAATPMKDLFRAAGVQKMQDLWLLLEYVDLLDEDDYRRALRGETKK